MKRLILIAFLIPTLALAACGIRAGAPSPEAPAAMALPPLSADFARGGAPAMAESYAAPMAPEALELDLANQAASADRLVIRNADLSIVVSDVPARVTAIQNMANAMGGFVVSSNIYETYINNGEKVPQAQVVVRVPSKRLDEALKQIKADTVEVQSESQSGQDVTDQHVDLNSRLTAKLAAEEQLLEIMQEARQTEDVLAVYAQLQQIQSDIEVLRGQIKYLEQSAALSAISVNIIAEETVKPIEVGPWKLDVAASEAIRNLIEFWRDFAEFVVRFFLFTLPVLITIAIPLLLFFLLIRWTVRKLRKPKAAASEAPKKK